MNNYFALAGIDRARLQDWNWACATFTWAVASLRLTQRACGLRPNNKRLRMAAEDTLAAISEQLENWEPPHRAN
jgi:hypothetical protein